MFLWQKEPRDSGGELQALGQLTSNPKLRNGDLMLDLQGIQGFRGDVESEHLQMDCNKLLNRLGPNPILVPIFTVFLPWHSRVLVQERGAGWRQKCEELGSAHH